MWNFRKSPRPKNDKIKEALTKYEDTMKVMIDELAMALGSRADELKENNNTLGKTTIELGYYELIQLVTALTVLEALRVGVKEEE